MPHQTGHNVLVSYKAESVFNTPVNGAGATQFRPNAGGKLVLNREWIRSNEVRADGKTAQGRLGTKSVVGSYPADASVGTFDPLLEAIFRGTFVAPVVITNATMTSITTQAGPPSTITAAAGSWLTQGVRVGDVGRLANHSTAANNGKNLRVTAVTALVITVAEALITDAVADSSFSFTIQKKLSQPSVPVRRSFTFDDYNQDLDLSKIATGVRVSSLKITGQPNGMALFEFGLVGADLTPLLVGTSPNFSSPTLSASIALTWLDAAIRLGIPGSGTDRLNLTAFELTLDMGAKGLPVIGSNVTPDIFENNLQGNGSISGTLQDFADFGLFTAETEVEFSSLLVEPEVEPKDNISLFVPRCKFSGFDDQIGEDGAKIITMPFGIGTKGAGVAGYDDSMMTLTTSAP